MNLQWMILAQLATLIGICITNMNSDALSLEYKCLTGLLGDVNGYRGQIPLVA
jgi:hypothetical protein